MERVLAAFRSADRKQSGLIKPETMAKMFQKICPGLPQDQVEAMIATVVTNQDGMIDYEEFIAWVYSDAGPDDETTQATDKGKTLAEENAELKQENTELKFQLAKVHPTTDGTTKHSTVDKYIYPESFQEIVESGAVRFLRGRFLVDLYKSGGRIERRQDMPDHAFWSAAEIMKMFNLDRKLLQCEYNGGQDFTVRLDRTMWSRVRARYMIVVLSYRWTQKEHPDASRHHLSTLVKFLTLYLDWVDSELGIKDVAVFWDFPSLLQRDRTPEEDQLFYKGLSSMNIIYGHNLSTVVMQTSQPAGSQDLDYLSSGWCRFERSVGCLSKGGLRFLDIGLLATQSYSSFKPAFHAMRRATKRPLPILPERMSQELNKTKFTNGKTDQGKVESMYADIATAVFSETRDTLDFGNIRFTAEDVETLAEVLPHFVQAQTIMLWGTQLGEDAAGVLGPALKKMPALKSLTIDCNIFGPNTGRLIAGALPPKLHVIFCNEGGVFGKVMAEEDFDAFIDALVSWVAQDSGPVRLDLRAVCSDTHYQALEQAWEKAGKDPAELVVWCDDDD